MSAGVTAADTPDTIRQSQTLYYSMNENASSIKTVDVPRSNSTQAMTPRTFSLKAQRCGCQAKHDIEMRSADNQV